MTVSTHFTVQTRWTEHTNHDGQSLLHRLNTLDSTRAHTHTHTRHDGKHPRQMQTRLAEPRSMMLSNLSTVQTRLTEHTHTHTQHDVKHPKRSGKRNNKRSHETMARRLVKDRLAGNKKNIHFARLLVGRWATGHTLLVYLSLKPNQSTARIRQDTPKRPSPLALDPSSPSTSSPEALATVSSVAAESCQKFGASGIFFLGPTQWVLGVVLSLGLFALVLWETKRKTNFDTYKSAC